MQRNPTRANIGSNVAILGGEVYCVQIGAAWGCASGMVSFAHRIAQLHMFDAGGRELGGAEKAPVFVCWTR
jgi:hypothetical protein